MRRINLYPPILMILLVIEAESGTLQGTDCRKASCLNSLAPGKLSYGLDQVRIMLESHHQLLIGVTIKKTHRVMTNLHKLSSPPFYTGQRCPSSSNCGYRACRILNMIPFYHRDK